MLQCTSSGCDGNSGHTSRTRSHSVITMSKRCATNSSRCLVRFALMSMPRVASCTRTAFGMQRLRDGCPRSRPRPFRPTSRSSSASAICERALFPVHRNSTRPAPDRRAWSAIGGAGASRNAGMQRAARGLQLVPARGEIDRVVAVAADRPSCDAPTRVRRRAADAGGTTPGSAARRRARSARARRDRCARARAAAATATDARPAARTPGDQPRDGAEPRSSRSRG